MTNKLNYEMKVNTADLEIVMTHDFDAPRALVFQVMTDPRLVPQWWGPGNLTTTVDTMDVRPGGRWRFIQRDEEGNEYAFNGAYEEVTPPERMVYTFEWEGMPGHIILETVVLEEQGGKTRAILTDKFQSKEDLEGMLAMGMEEGAVATQVRLAKLLEEIQKE